MTCVCVPQAGSKVPEVTDGSCLSRQPIGDGVVRPHGAGPPGNNAPAAVGQLEASLAVVHSEHTHLFIFGNTFDFRDDSAALVPQRVAT